MLLSKEKDEPVLPRDTDRQSSHPEEKPGLINTVSCNLKYLYLWQMYLQNGHSVFEPQQRQSDWGLGGGGERRVVLFLLMSGLWETLGGQNIFTWCYFTYGPGRKDFQWELHSFVFRDCPEDFCWMRLKEICHHILIRRRHQQHAFTFHSWQ